MKLALLSLTLWAALQASPAALRAAEPESKPSATLLEEAETLAQIYLKLRLLGSSLEGPELKEYLDAMNRGLDKVLAFRDSFTPEKKKKIEGQLKSLQKESAKLLDRNAEQIRKELPKLVDHLHELVKTLAQ